MAYEERSSNVESSDIVVHGVISSIGNVLVVSDCPKKVKAYFHACPIISEDRQNHGIFECGFTTGAISTSFPNDHGFNPAMHLYDTLNTHFRDVVKGNKKLHSVGVRVL